MMSNGLDDFPLHLLSVVFGSQGQTAFSKCPVCPRARALPCRLWSEGWAGSLRAGPQLPVLPALLKPCYHSFTGRVNSPVSSLFAVIFSIFFIIVEIVNYFILVQEHGIVVRHPHNSWSDLPVSSTHRHHAQVIQYY